MSLAAKSKKESYPIPDGATAGDWFIARELSTFVVKRMLTLADGSRTAQRAKRQDYSRYVDHYSDTEKEDQTNNPGESSKPSRALEDFVMRMNGRDPKVERLKTQVRFDHAWINDQFLQAYREEILYQNIQDRTNADALFQYLNRYALTWFLVRKKAFTVQSWKVHEKEWGKYLLNQDEDQKNMTADLRLFRDDDSDPHLTPKSRQLSAKVLKYTLYEMNRFIRYVYAKRRSEFSDELIQLEPWGPNFLEGYAANWRVKHPVRVSRYIKPEHWEIIAQAMKQRDIVWRHQAWLAHDYGLRRRETMGLEVTSVQTGCLHLLQQLKKLETVGTQQSRTFKALKGREKERKIPHWFSEPKVTRARIKAMLESPLPHPDSLSEGFRNLFTGTRIQRDAEGKWLKDANGEALLFNPLSDSKGNALPPYTFHDLRRTFITNAVKKGITVEDLRQTTGHKDPQVLVKFYLMDARELESDILVEEDEEIEV